MPAKAITSASDNMRAATLPEVRRGAWIRLSAASAPSTGRTAFSSGRMARASASESSGTAAHGPVERVPGAVDAVQAHERWGVLVIEGIVRSCRTFQNGTRNILGFYLPGEVFGWTDLKHALSLEAATDVMILYLKRSALLSIAARDSRISSFLLDATTNELRRTQEHALLIGRSAKCRLATFLLDLSSRLGKTKYLDLPMSHQDIADHLGLTLAPVPAVELPHVHDLGPPSGRADCSPDAEAQLVALVADQKHGSAAHQFCRCDAFQIKIPRHPNC
jgi:hypothetical protein